MRLIFMGTPEFSVPALRALCGAGHDIAAVYTQPPRPAGRGKKDRASAVHAAALELGLEVWHPPALKAPDIQSDFAALDADIAVVVAYGLILPQVVLAMPRRGCLNIHASLLPRWRGAAPIQRAIMAGDAQTGVSIMQMEAGLDTGPVLLTRAIDIQAAETAGELHDRLSALGAEAIIDALERLDDLTPTAQPEAGVTYAAKIDKSEAAIDFDKPAEAIARQICGLSPFPGAWTLAQGRRLKLLRARAVAGKASPGTVISDLTIACREGAVQISEVQAEGRARQKADVFLRGTPIAPGTKMGDS